MNSSTQSTTDYFQMFNVKANISQNQFENFIESKTGSFEEIDIAPEKMIRNFEVLALSEEISRGFANLN